MSSVGRLGRLLMVRTQSSSSSSSSSSTSSSSSLSLGSRRWLATSAQKRKWNKNQSSLARRGKKVDLLVEKETTQRISKADEIREKGVNWRPIFFLGVFPILMSGIVVLSRDDLRQELDEKGLGRALMDFRNWRTQRALNYERQQLLRENETQNERQNEERVVVEKAVAS